MSKKTLHILLLCSSAFSLVAQPDSAQFLNEVTVVDSRIEALKIAQFQYKTDSVQQLISPAVNMAEWLQQVSAVHVRQYAPGSAASFSTRGATSAQSAILWSGFQLNSAATGVTDLSLVPSAMFRPSLLLGGSASYFGSGAIGGVLNLAESTKNQPGWHGNFNQFVGSFSTFKTSIGVNYANEKFASQTNFYLDKSKNDYPFLNQYKIPASEQSRGHAGYNQSHIKQYLSYQLNAANKLEAEVWFNNAERQTPNSVLVNKPAAALLTDNYLRSRVNWSFAKSKNVLNVSYAFLYEWQTYEDSTLTDLQGNGLKDTNITASHVVQANYERLINNRWKWQNGVLIRNDDVSGSNRKGSQNTASAQSGLFYSFNRLSAQAVLRAEVWDGNFQPVSPFASARVRILKNVFASIYGGYNYRIPSLNDRFWVPGGNINLQPESGWTGEGAVFYDKASKRQSLLVRFSSYKSTISNYIQWIPGAGGIWSPQNVKMVGISGLDFNTNFSKQRYKWFFAAQINLSLNNAKVKESEVTGDESIGQQLIYQPKYKAALGSTVGYSGWNVRADYCYTSSVTTSYDGGTQDLAAFQIVDVSLSKSFQLKKLSFTAIGAVNNIGNQVYQTIPYFPMPGRNFSITLKISI